MDGQSLCCNCLDIRVLSRDCEWVDWIKITSAKELGEDGRPLYETEGKNFKTGLPSKRIQLDTQQKTFSDHGDVPVLRSSSYSLMHVGTAATKQGESCRRKCAIVQSSYNTCCQHPDAHLRSASSKHGNPLRTKPQNLHWVATHLNTKSNERVTLTVLVDPILAACLMCELVRSQAYINIFMRGLLEQIYATQAMGVKPAMGEKATMRLKPTKCVKKIKMLLVLTESALFSIEPDIRWSKRMLPMWLVRISLDDAFSWLSTLGGAFSALGDESLHFAEKAGEVSMHQMRVALQLGDPILQARCLVYLAQSLLQKGCIRTAMCIVRKQYQFALSLGECTDQRLINMCRGVWSIIQFWHERKRERRKQCMGLHHQHRTKASFSR